MPAAAEWVEQNGIATMHMTALENLGGVAALFTGRAGGASSRWGGGLNWSYAVDDDPSAVVENKRRTLALLGLTSERAVMAGLVHGNRVVAVTGEEPPGRDRVAVVDDCDGLVTDRPKLALVVTAADCVPLYFYDPVRRAIGVAHAGWRGTVAGVGAAAVAALTAHYGSDPADIHAVVGPAIGKCCYEVGDQVADPLRAYFGADANALLTPAAVPGKYFLDLWEANRIDLHRAGIRNVQISGECTACGVARLFSHRAESGMAGRGAAVISLT